MARRKQDILDRLMDSFSLRGFLLHQATLFVAASCLVIGGVVFLWKNNQASIVNVAEYQLTPNKIVMPEPPPWVDLDLREVIVGPDESPSILDPTLIARTAEQVERMAFVDQVHSISKSMAGVEIDLDYRRPVAMVLINSQTMPGVIENGEGIMLAIDRNGIVMPKQLSEKPPVSEADYEKPRTLPIISLAYPVKRQAQLITWADWPDERVRAAATISQHFAGRDLGLFRVVTFQKRGQLGQDHPFELWSKWGVHGTRIIWGVETNSQGGTEATVMQKLAAIDDLISRLGPLERVPNGQSLGRVFDVSTGKAVELSHDKVAALPEMKF